MKNSDTSIIWKKRRSWNSCKRNTGAVPINELENNAHIIYPRDNAMISRLFTFQNIGQLLKAFPIEPAFSLDL